MERWHKDSRKVANGTWCEKVVECFRECVKRTKDAGKGIILEKYINTYPRPRAN